MTETIADILKTKIHGAGLSFVEKVAGIATVQEKLNENDDRGVIFRYPRATNVLGGSTKTGFKYDALTPDGSLRSLIFFEDQGTPINTGSRNHEARMRLLFWANLANNGQTDNSGNKTDEYTADIINVIQGNQGNSGSVNGIHVVINQVVPRDKSIFSRYSFEEHYSQYLMLPYTYFALDITATFRLNHSC